MKQYMADRHVKMIFFTACRMAWRFCRLKIQKFVDMHCCGRPGYKESAGGISPIIFPEGWMDSVSTSKEKAEILWKMYEQHQFDLLGSGWVKNDYNHKAPGMEGYCYENEYLEIDAEGEFLRKILGKQNFMNSRRIYSRIAGAYEPIDWHRDFKSGYRWSAAQWYRLQKPAGSRGKNRGIDIKVPWELSRLQHLPRLALLGWMLPQKERIFQEFRSQLLDFIAQNPVRMGVNHMCTMDVGIRTANIALSCSLWKGMGKNFDPEFERITADYLFQECSFIRSNLEWSYFRTTNHYFADVAGLLWGSAVLPDSSKRRKWLKFARDQVISEIRKQFHEDGSNGEGSTAYHRLTGEMAVYSAALIHYLSQHEGMEDAGQDIYDLMYRAGRFMHDVTRPDGMFTQIGDNDSGIFFKLSITGGINSGGHLEENMNDGRTYIAAVQGMFDAPQLGNAGRQYPIEYRVIKNLIGNDKIPYSKKRHIGKAGKAAEGLNYKRSFLIGGGEKSLLKGLRRTDYPEFGIYIFRSEEMYLCFNLSDNGQNGNGGHAHNDKLSFELFLHGKCIFEDPGTFVYTPFPELRDHFRSTKCHNTVYCGEEQNRFNGLFSMHNDTKCFLTFLDGRSIEAQAEYRGIVHRRRIEIFDQCIKITDCCNRKFRQQFVQMPVARGYGKMEHV